MSSPLSNRKCQAPIVALASAIEAERARYHVERTSSATFKLWRDGALVGGVYYVNRLGWRAFVHKVGKRHGHYWPTLEEAASKRWKAHIVALFTAAQENQPVVSLDRFDRATRRMAFHVECKWPSTGFFEPIAAFDNGQVANAYAESCRVANGTLEYRVVSYEGILASA